MGSEEHTTPTQRKSSEIFNELEESSESKEKREKEASMSQRNLVKIDSLTMGEQYHGEVKDGKREGQGICVYKNGDRYEGCWKNNKKEGKGTYYYTQKGDVYKGNFFNDYPNGKGIYFYKNGDKYEGMFKDGKKHGEGVIIFVNGGRFKGEFKNGEKHGKGEYKNQNGQVRYELWEKGQLRKNNEKEFNENDSVNLQNENETKKFDEFLKNRGNYKKKLNEKISLFDKFKSIKERLKNKVNDQQYVQMVNIVKKNPNIELWSVDDVKALFNAINLDKYIINIENNAIDGKKFLFLDNQMISNIFNITDKNEIKIISELIKFIGDISNNEKEKKNLDIDDNENINNSNNNIMIINNEENNNVNKNLFGNKDNKYETKRTSKFIKKLTQENIKNKEDEEEKNGEFFNSNESNNSDELIKLEKEKTNINKGKSEFYSSLNNNSLNFFINYDEIKKERPIGKGGMGELYLGEWQGKQVAMKKIKLNYIKNNILSNKFINEINIIASMRHPNILLFMGVTIDNNTYYMITEYLPSGSLHEYLHLSKKNKKNPLTDKQKIKIALQIAIAVQYIHSRQILHCDLKSANVLIDNNFNIKLIDFGLSYFMNEAPKGYIGTPRWMAPEILKGGQYSVSSDIFSYGMILMELLTEKVPYFDVFNYEVTKEIIKKYVFNQINQNKPILPLPENGNKVLRYIASKCLEAKPENRISMEKIIKILSKANQLYEEVDEVTLDMFGFLS